MSPYLKNLRTQIGSDLLLFGAVAAAIWNEQGELLLQYKGEVEGWSLPAGMIEPGEHPAQALRREVLEETGLQVRPSRLLGVFGGEAFRYTYPNGDQVEPTVLLFACEPLSEWTFAPTDSETQGLTFWSKAEFPGLALPYPLEVLFGEIAEPFFFH
jgi:ADP-ribose pyrophosphatase YjhB (NUDIX family)